MQFVVHPFMEELCFFINECRYGGNPVTLNQGEKQKRSKRMLEQVFCFFIGLDQSHGKTMLFVGVI